MFRDTYLDKRNRWIGTITRNTLKLHGPGLGTSLTDCYNDFSLLERNASSEREKDEGEVAIPIRADDVSIEDLRDYVVRYNTRYKNAVPVLKRRMSEQIARPGLITDLLKKLHQHTCQLCRKPGFMQRNGIPYVESHHIVELHQLVAGSYCSDNIVVVCADCHRKLHYAQILYAAEGLEITVRINETEIYRFQRNVLSTDSLQA
jgi:5-methylcytosine-specific restriction endonuclease McrA